MTINEFISLDNSYVVGFVAVIVPLMFFLPYLKLEVMGVCKKYVIRMYQLVFLIIIMARDSSIRSLKIWILLLIVDY